MAGEQISEAAVDPGSRRYPLPEAKPGLPEALILAGLYLRGFWERAGPRIAAWLPGLLVAAALAWMLSSGPSLEGLGVVAGVAAIAIGLRSAFRPGAVLSPIVMPEELAKAGWTGELAAARILDAAAEMARGAAAHDPKEPYLQPPGDPLPKIEVPGFNLSPGAFGDLLRELVGARRPQLGGEVTPAADGRFRLRLRGLPRGRWVEVGPAAPEDLVAQAGEMLLAELVPYMLAYALYTRGDYAGAMRVAARGASREDLPAAENARCGVLRWLLLRRVDKPEEAHEALARAAWRDWTHPMVAFAVGAHVEQGAPVTKEESAFWQRMSRVAGRWRTGTRGLDRRAISDADQEARWHRQKKEEARYWMPVVRSNLARADEHGGKLENLLLHPYGDAKAIAQGWLDMGEALDSAAEYLAKAAELDPELADSQEFKTLKDRGLWQKAWRDAQADPRIAQGAEGIAAIDQAHRILFEGLAKIGEESWAGVAYSAWSDAEAALRRAREIWPRGTRRVMGLSRTLDGRALVEKLMRDRLQAERLAENMRLLPAADRLHLRRAIRLNNRLVKWLAKKVPAEAERARERE